MLYAYILALTWLQLFDLNTDSWVNVLSICLSILTHLALIAFTINLYRVIYRANLEDESYKKKFGFLFESFKKDRNSP